MDKLFMESIDAVSAYHTFSREESKLLSVVDKAADDFAISEFEHYINKETNPDMQKVVKKNNLFGIPVSKEHGGLGMDMLMAVLTNQRFGHVSLGFPTFFDVNVFIAELTLQRWGTARQKMRYLRSMVKGERIFSFALTEPEAGSDPSMMKTEYEKRDGRFVLNGTKYLITNGSIADNMIVFAKSKSNPKDITAFIIDTNDKGFGVGMKLKEKLGLFTSDTAMPVFKNLEVSPDDVLGTEGKGLHVAYSALMSGRMGIASGCLGVIEGSLKAVTARAKERVQHGKPIGKHQLIQRHIAEIRQNLEMARWPTYFAAMRAKEYDGEPNNPSLRSEMDLRTSLAKKIASRLAFESADRAVQVFGGFGYSLLSPVGALFLDSRVARIYEGTDEIQELKIASKVLGEGFEAFS